MYTAIEFTSNNPIPIYFNASYPGLRPSYEKTGETLQPNTIYRGYMGPLSNRDDIIYFDNVYVLRNDVEIVKRQAKIIPPDNWFDNFDI